MSEMTKGAFVAIVGKPNVGKSSIMNRILGQKVAIVSDKPQTTRNRIMGVLTEKETQIVFIDTPGLHKPRNVLGQSMVKAIEDSVGDVDVAMLVVDAAEFKGEPSKADMSLIERFKKQRIPAILVINKIDLLNDKEKLLAVTSVYTSEFDF
ncbi:MAG: GTPase Era, partial [Clostridia bacterium]|nr:GTPase Era [Clostridia bacterium]